MENTKCRGLDAVGSGIRFCNVHYNCYFCGIINQKNMLTTIQFQPFEGLNRFLNQTIFGGSIFPEWIANLKLIEVLAIIAGVLYLFLILRTKPVKTPLRRAIYTIVFAIFCIIVFGLYIFFAISEFARFFGK